jgi:multidrug resistance efflux pump
MFNKIKTLIAALVIFSFLGGAVPTQALDRDHDNDRRCEQQIHKAEANLQKAVRKHGERSRQAEQKRHQLEEARERCHRDHDHDRDHDHR